MSRVPDPAKRAALIDAAARVLGEEGMDAVSVRRLARELGTSTMAVYTVFGGKPELMRAVYHEAFSRFGAALGAVATDGDPLSDLAALGWAYRAYALAEPHLYEVMFGRSSVVFDPEPSDVEMALGTFEILVAAVERAVNAGALRCEPVLGARQIWAAAHGAVSLELVERAQGIAEDGATFASLLTNLVVGLGARP